MCGLAGRGQLRSSLRSTLGGLVRQYGSMSWRGPVRPRGDAASLRSVTVQPAPVSNGESPQRPLER
ncbi:hypothetical protein CU044_0437 [Streptomyces sp. L-9-10]|nr:hypothetical protein CU044_0437 [Streptomyces sp. L-9-10]